MKYLTTVVETYRVDSEAEVAQMVESAKQDKYYTLVKYASEKKEKKSKGEVIDVYYKLVLTKAFNDISLPDRDIEVTYNARF